MSTSLSAAQSVFALDSDAKTNANALPLARLAKLAYGFDAQRHGDRHAERFPDIPLLDQAFPVMRTIERGSIEGFVAANNTDVIVSVRGYQDPDRWIDAIPHTQIPGYGGRVSEGVRDGSLAVWDDVLAAFFDANAGEKTLWLTGHSIGGAIATVLAAELDAEGFDIAAVYTFGAPAVFDKDAASAFQPELHRFVSDGDWIPDMQWPRITSKYVHTGQRHLLMRSGAVGSGRYPDHLARRIDRFMNIETPMGYGGPVEDHRMDEYLRRLRLLEQSN
jgi:triacylglycerol lipase